MTASEDAAKLLQSYRGESNNFIDRFLMPVFCNALPEYNLMEHISMSVEVHVFHCMIDNVYMTCYLNTL